MSENASMRQSPLVELYCSTTTWSPQDQQWSSWFLQFQAVLNLSFEESIPWEEWSSTLHMVQTSERPLSGKNISFLSGHWLRKWPSPAQTSLDKNKKSSSQIYSWFVSYLLLWRSSLIKKGFWKMIFLSAEEEASYMQKWWRVSVFSFTSSTPTEKSQKIFLLFRKIFWERKISFTRLEFGAILLREQNGQSRPGSIAPSCPFG